MIRTFIAIEPPQAVQDVLGEITERLGPELAGVKWVRPEGRHLTLKFLGSIQDDLVGPLSQGLDLALQPFGPLELCLAHLGVFPHRRRARVIWVGLAGDLARLAGVAAAIDRSCTTFGVEPDRRPFQGHITLGRRKVPSVIDLDVQVEPAAFIAEAVHIYRSELLPTGARYTKLHTSYLGG